MSYRHPYVLRPMPYCAVHQRAYTMENKVPPNRYPAHWGPLSPYTVALALAYAAAFSCAGTITVQASACDVCAEEGTA